MFYKKVDLRKKDDMLSFLNNHFRYYTMNSWNGTTSYANNIKLYNLDIPDALYEKAWKFATGIDNNNEPICNNPFDCVVNTAIEKFIENTGYDVGFGGRSGGYLVMYKTEFDTSVGRFVTKPGKSVYFGYNDETMEELRKQVKILQCFDKMCDEIREGLIDICKKYDFETEEFTYTKYTTVVKKVA